MTLLAPLFQKAVQVERERDVVVGDLMPVGMTGYLTLSRDYTAAYEEIIKRQLWARIAVNKLAYSIGRLPLKAYRRGADGARERVTDTPLAELLRRPNDTKETGNPVGFQARIAYDLYTYANAIIVKVQTRPDAVPVQLLPVSPRYWTIDADGNYVYSGPEGQRQVYPPWRIIHLIEPGPTVDGFGVSRLEAARLTLAIEYAAQRLGVATFENGARPSSIINLKRSDLSKEAIERFKAEVLARFGGVERTGIPAVLEGDIEWHTLTHNLNDAAVVAHRQLTREEVAALFDIPQPAIGILDEANFASVDALHVMFYQDTLGWPIRLIEQGLQAQLIDGVPAFADQFVEFDLNAVMRGAFKQRMEGYRVGIAAGIFTSDEVRAWENLPSMADKQPEAGLLRFPVNYATGTVPDGPGGEEELDAGDRD